MSDIYLTDTGDLALGSNGDIALVDTTFRNYAQQAYLRMMTEQNDFTMYPTIGANLESLIGMANTEKTGELGRQLVLASLDRDGTFASVSVDVKAVPISFDTIRFDVYISAGSRSEMILSIEQNLTVAALEA